MMKTSMLSFVFFFFFDFCLCYVCKNEKNQPVDWYVLYKLPQEHNHINPLIKEGLSYIFITSETVDNGWMISNISINEANSFPGLTLQPSYDKSSKMHIFYNDEMPDGHTNDYLGHTKGVISSDDTNGFWLIHSVPHYPPKELYSYPSTGIKYGQSFLCISFNLQNLNNVGQQLQYNEPNIYNSYISNSLQTKLSNINAVINNETIKASPWFRLTTLYSLQNRQFVSFAKGKRFGKEIYQDWIAPALKNNLLVETWLNGPGKIPSNCSNTFKVNNIKSLKVSTADLKFHSSLDHSKWTVANSENNLKPWICVGDINREEHQESRGGGTVCIREKRLWQQYKNIINDVEPCEN